MAAVSSADTGLVAEVPLTALEPVTGSVSVDDELASASIESRHAVRAVHVRVRLREHPLQPGCLITLGLPGVGVKVYKASLDATLYWMAIPPLRKPRQMSMSRLAALLLSPPRLC